MVITKQLTALDELNQKVSQLKDVNNQLEYTWGQKYQDDIAGKNKEVARIKKEALESLEKHM